MSAPQVSAIVVSWNAKERLDHCLERLARQTPHELIVVDNGSTDGSREMLGRRQDLRLIELDNPGFGAANNAGARLARGRYLLLLNSDCELQDDALHALAQALDENPRTGVVGPLLRRPDGRIQRSAGRAPSLLTETLNKTMLHRAVRYYTYGSWDYTGDRCVDWVSGACMMVRREAYEQVGGFDERFFMFMEDLDLCRRIRDAGYQVRFTARAAAVHHGGGSQTAVRTAMLLESERSVRLYFAKHHGPRALGAVRVLSMVEAVVRSCLWLPALAVPRLRGQAVARLRAYPRLVKRDPRSTPPRVGKMLASASATAILQAASNAMGFALTVLLARFLGSAGYGHYALAFAWSSVLTTPAILGLNTFLVRGVAVYEVHERWPLMRGLLLRTNQLVLLTSTAIAIGGTIVALTWLSPSFRGPFCVAMLLIPLTALTLLRQGAMQAFGRVVSGQLPEYLVRPLLIIAGVVALELAGREALTPTTALWANVAGVSVAFVVGAALLRRALPAALRSAVPQFVTREWLRASLPMMLIAGVWMANAYATTLVVGTLGGARMAGVYSVVQRGSEVIVLVLGAINMPLAPVIARLHARDDRRALEHTTERMARAALMASAAVSVAFIALRHVYLGFFGPGFHTGATALVILALGQLVNAAAGPTWNVLVMTGQERVAVRAGAAALLASLALAIALVPPLGVTGGAIAFACGLVLWNTALALLARRRLGINVTAFARLSMRAA